LQSFLDELQTLNGIVENYKETKVLFPVLDDEGNIIKTQKDVETAHGKFLKSVSL